MPYIEPVVLSGFARPPFEDLADYFARVIAAQQHGGAALTVYHRGVCVVDLIGGGYRADSVQLLFSVSKAVTAIAAAIAAREGLLDLDAPLSDYWPAFARAETRNVTARSVLSHRSGLAAVDRSLTLADLVAGRDVDAIEQQQPYWEPGTAHGYHAFTFGTLLQGIFQRTVGTTVGDFVVDRISQPLDLDLWLGLPADQHHRVETIHYEPRQPTPGSVAFAESSEIPAGTTGQLSQTMDIYNSPELMRLGAPSSSGVAGARDLARMFAATLGDVDGVRLLTPEERDQLIQKRSDGPDRVLGVRTAFGSGVQRPFPQFPLLSSDSYGHEAAGGSAAFADPRDDLAVGFTTNVYPPNAGASTGFLSLLGVLRHCLREAGPEEAGQSRAT